MPAALRLPKGPLTAEVYRRIREQISSGYYSPGTVISEREWASLLDVGSRTPLREALKALAAEGWIESLPQKGTRIVPLTETDIAAIYEVRTEIEGFGAVAAASRADPAGIAALRGYVADLRHELDIGDLAGLLDTDLAIHRQVAHMSTNQWLLRTVDFLAWSVKRLGQQSLLQPGRSGAMLLEHEALLRAIERQDGAAARVHIQMHLLNSRNFALLTMESQRRSAADRGSPPRFR